jgi:hypothetical protein
MGKVCTLLHVRGSSCRASLTHACMISIKGRRNDNVTSKVAHPRAVWNYFCALATRQQNYTLRWREQENTSIPNCSPTLLLTSERYVGTGQWEKIHFAPIAGMTPRQIIGWTFYLPSNTHFSPSLVFAAMATHLSGVDTARERIYFSEFHSWSNFLLN